MGIYYIFSPKNSCQIVFSEFKLIIGLLSHMMMMMAGKGNCYNDLFIRNHRRLSLGPDLPVSSSLATPTICEGAANRHHRLIIVIIIVINHHQHNVNIIIMIIIRFTMFLIEWPPFEYTVLLTIIGESLSLVSFIRDHQYHNKKKLSLQVTVRSKLNNIT